MLPTAGYETASRQFVGQLAGRVPACVGYSRGRAGGGNGIEVTEMVYRTSTSSSCECQARNPSEATLAGGGAEFFPLELF